MTNLVHLESFRKEMMAHPWWFWQLQAIGSTFVDDCDQTVTEYAYQASDAAGRDDIRTKLAIFISPFKRAPPHCGARPFGDRYSR